MPKTKSVPEIPSERQYWRNIISIISVKAVAIFILWWVCFSHPMSAHMTDAKVLNHMMTASMSHSSNQELL